MHAIATLTRTLGICTCGEGFSGARVAERLDSHIASPDPDSLGALLIGFIASTPDA